MMRVCTLAICALAIGAMQAATAAAAAIPTMIEAGRMLFHSRSMASSFRVFVEHAQQRGSRP
jgi:uncharacterized protein involved in response to NO